MSNPLDEQRTGFKVTNPYAGRWVSRIRDQIIGQGGTPAQALIIRTLVPSKRTTHPQLYSLPYDPYLSPDSVRVAEDFCHQRMESIWWVVLLEMHCLARPAMTWIWFVHYSAKQFAKKAANELGGCVLHHG